MTRVSACVHSGGGGVPEPQQGQQATPDTHVITAVHISFSWGNQQLIQSLFRTVALNYKQLCIWLVNCGQEEQVYCCVTLITSAPVLMEMHKGAARLLLWLVGKFLRNQLLSGLMFNSLPHRAGSLWVSDNWRAKHPLAQMAFASVCKVWRNISST